MGPKTYWSTATHTRGHAHDRLNRRQANDDNQSEHHGVFDGGGTIFGLEKTTNLQSERIHDGLQRDVTAARLSEITQPCTEFLLRIELAERADFSASCSLCESSNSRVRCVAWGSVTFECGDTSNGKAWRTAFACEG